MICVVRHRKTVSLLFVSLLTTVCCIQFVLYEIGMVAAAEIPTSDVSSTVLTESGSTASSRPKTRVELRDDQRADIIMGILDDPEGFDGGTVREVLRFLQGGAPLSIRVAIEIGTLTPLSSMHLYDDLVQKKSLNIEKDRYKEMVKKFGTAAVLPVRATVARRRDVFGDLRVFGDTSSGTNTTEILPTPQRIDSINSTQRVISAVFEPVGTLLESIFGIRGNDPNGKPNWVLPSIILMTLVVLGIGVSIVLARRKRYHNEAAAAAALLSLSTTSQHSGSAFKDINVDAVLPQNVKTMLFIAPVSQSILAGTITLQIGEQDKEMIDHINIVVDNKIISVLRKLPYTTQYNTTALHNGWHRFLALAYSIDQALIGSGSTLVNIQNAG